uniref:Uncharacterized protein n=1 Tax=Leptocylindrus danicus TaxID=163516 RepID=A0A7S2P1Y1_9STRA|mmetsp:Transcript_21038/g.31394  ORF Transcript_21038/g.31394 Transcript_21038/m.31394 type:complete len:165 (+) Transcript_21038:237-731(+)
MSPSSNSTGENRELQLLLVILCTSQSYMGLLNDLGSEGDDVTAVDNLQCRERRDCMRQRILNIFLRRLNDGLIDRLSENIDDVTKLFENVIYKSVTSSEEYSSEYADDHVLENRVTVFARYFVQTHLSEVSRSQSGRAISCHISTLLLSLRDDGYSKSKGAEAA